MEHGLQVTEVLTAIGQVQWEHLQQARDEGFKAVLNLRSPDELGFLANEQELVESLGLHYTNIPLRLEKIDEFAVTRILKTLEKLPKPTLVHCAAGIRSIAIALLSTAIQEGLTAEQTVEKARSLGFHYIDCTIVSTQLKQQFFGYIARHSPATVVRAA